MGKSISERYPGIRFEHVKANTWCRETMEQMYKEEGFKAFEDMSLGLFCVKFCSEHLKRTVVPAMNDDERHWFRDVVKVQLDLYAKEKERKAIAAAPKVPRTPQNGISKKQKKKPLDHTLGLILTSCAIKRKQAQEWSKKELMQELLERLGQMRSNGWRPLSRRDPSWENGTPEK